MTPHSLLSEIHFISDGNVPGETFKDDVKALNPPDKPDLAHVTENSERLGLIRAKKFGADHAREGTNVLMFYEPHCMAGKDW